MDVRDSIDSRTKRDDLLHRLRRSHTIRNRNAKSQASINELCRQIPEERLREKDMVRSIFIFSFPENRTGMNEVVFCYV